MDVIFVSKWEESYKDSTFSRVLFLDMNGRPLFNFKKKSFAFNGKDIKTHKMGDTINILFDNYGNPVEL